MSRALAVLVVLAGAARAQMTVDQVIAADRTDVVGAVVAAGGVAGVDEAALGRLAASGLHGDAVRFVAEYRTLEDWPVWTSRVGDLEVRRPPGWNVWVDSIGTVTVSRERMVADDTEINSGVSIVLLENPDPSRFGAERLEASGAELHRAVVDLAGRRGDEIWDVRPRAARVAGVACARFDAFMNTHRDDRLEIWTHYGFPADGRMLLLMASRNRDEPGSAAIMDRIVGSIRLPEGAWTTWRDEATGAGGLVPARWSVRRADGEVAIRPASLGRRAQVAWSSREGAHGPEAHRDACYEVRQSLGSLVAVPEAAPVRIGGADALSTWLDLPGERVRVVTLGAGGRVHRLIVRLPGSPEDHDLRQDAQAIERIVRSFRTN